ncbi:MAG TPA: alpha/beta fold hydrolase [Ardenticatenaceae bacterium]|nr:alpha/beta fold hydrolase [Ardenticatenaceae bacterium]
MALMGVDGQELFYQARGRREDGPAVLFVHGAGGTWRHWGLQMRDLEPAYRVGLDLPGHGRSGGPGRRTIDEYAAVVLGFMDALELGSATVVGHSMGGAIALTMALQAPDVVEGLGLVGTGGRLPVNPAILDGLLQPDPRPTIRLISEWSYRRQAPEAQVAQGARELSATDPVVYHGDYSACNAFDLSGSLDAIHQLALVLTAMEDRMTPPEWARTLAEGLPNASLRLVENAGHMVMLEQSGAVTVALRQFLGLEGAEGRETR